MSLFGYSIKDIKKWFAPQEPEGTVFNLIGLDGAEELEAEILRQKRSEERSEAARKAAATRKANAAKKAKAVKKTPKKKTPRKKTPRKPTK